MRNQNQNLGGSRARRWFGYLWHEWIGERWRPIAPAFARANPAEWSDNRITAAWLDHATVLINFFGIKILTDPVLFPRIGVRLPGLTFGPKRLTASALTVRDLPKIDIVLLSHAHFDHFDMRTLHRFHRSTTAITAHRTSDLLRWTRFRDVSELRWNERKSVSTSAGKIDIVAFRVKHWGARTRRDVYRGYNGYVFERNNRRIIFSGDTALSDSFAELRASGPIDLAIMPIGAYNPWIHSHCTPEQAVCTWPMKLALISSYRSIIKLSVSAPKAFVSRSSASRLRCGRHRNASPSATSAKHSSMSLYPALACLGRGKSNFALF
jgi:L-ascorbate metabolism protein UlaG (beta-lactamase superfamily)